jgi:oligopeptide transport system substrate-binding protein
MKRILVLLFSIIFLVPIVATGCGEKADFVACIGSNPTTIDPALNSTVDGATYIIHAFSGLVTWAQKSDGSLELAADCAEEIPEPTPDPDTDKVTYVFKLKEGLKWSDGKALKASDFEYSWKRAAADETMSDYQYIFEVIDGYPNDLNVTADDTERTLTVVLTQDVPYFIELCAFPTYMPVRKDIIEEYGEEWATNPKSYIGNGPYKIVKWRANSKIVMEKNPYYHNADLVKFNRIEWALSDNDGAMLANYKNGTFDFIDSVPNAEISNLKKDYPNEFFVEGQLGTYYISFNINADIFEDMSYEDAVNFRKAISLLIDRNYICEEIGKAGQQPANGFVPTGLTDADTAIQFVDKNGPDRDGSGYYTVDKDGQEAREAQAVQILKDLGFNWNESQKKFTDVPTIKYLFNTNTGHQAIAEYIQSALDKYGIPMQLANQDWNTFVETRKEGAYALARNGWLADYNDPISFLDMWLSTSGNNDARFGKDAHENVRKYTYKGEGNKTWAESYDRLIQDIKAEKDPETRYELMHQAEDMIMETGCIIPIYYYVDIFMIKTNIKGFFTSPLGYKFFMFAEKETAQAA